MAIWLGRLTNLVLFPLLVVALSFSAGPDAATVYVGTYTDAGSRGIYRFTFDFTTGTASAPSLAAESENPSFLARHPSGRFLYAANELESFEGEPAGAVSAYAVDVKTGDLAFLNRRSSRGTAPCHLSVDRTGRGLLVANYGGGNVALLPIAPDGRLAPAAVVRAHSGSGPNRGRQEAAHAHQIALDLAQHHALSTDLGADRVLVYRFDARHGTLEPHAAAALPPGSGPRHLAFDPQGRYVYVINELLSTVTALRYDEEAGALEMLETVSALPAGFAGSSSGAEIAVSADGRFVYASNRGHDSLVVFRVERDGRLALVGHVSVGGRTPRHFALDPTGRWLLVALQDSGSIAVFRVDRESGLPAATGVSVPVSKPVSVLFAER